MKKKRIIDIKFLNLFKSKSGYKILFCLLVCMSFQSVKGVENSSTSKWVGTWSCAPYAAGTNTPPAPYLANNTLRQIVRVSIGGDTLRVKFSNITCSTPVTLNSVNIAVSTEVGGSAIDVSTLKQLRFSGSESVTMNAYSSVISDPIAYPLTQGIHLAITIYYGQCQTAADMTHHYGSRTDSYILTGDQTQNESFSGATPIERWYTINTIDVLTSDDCAAVAVLGNSITDGYGLHGGLKNKWTDKFSENLLGHSATSNVSVLNLGIGATWLTSSGISRFQQDILDQNGLRWIIIFYGVNDIGGGTSADDIIKAYKSLIAKAHAANIRIYGGTITPFKGNGYYSTAHEAVRVEVNNWIRTAGYFDKVIDFDQFIRDPLDPEQLYGPYSNDWLHPNVDGYRILGESIDLNLFLGEDTVYEKPDYGTYYYEPECATVGSNWEIVANSQVSNKYVTVKAGTQSLTAAPTSANDIITIPFAMDSAGTYSFYARLNCPTPDDDSFWVKINNGTFEMKNGLWTSGWEWKLLGEYQLMAGDNVLTVAYREDGAELDKIAISNAPFSPDGLGEVALNSCDITGTDKKLHLELNSLTIRNFPNPFSDFTMIDFCIEKQEDVCLKIYNSLGQEINDLISKCLEAGDYKLMWNGTNYGGVKQTSGIYICILIVGMKTYTIKMQLIN